jgi:hypothetical protein
MSLKWDDEEFGRWKAAPRGGTRVVRGTKFIPCKVLLSEMHAMMPDAFSPDMLLQRLVSSKIRLSLCIDVTFDSKSYYHNPNVWKDWDIEMLKLKTTAKTSLHPPPLSSLWTFVENVKRKLRSDPQGYVLIYSQQGCNIAGFYIVGYMCEVLGFNLSDALKTFKECREPGIYCKSTLRSLQFINEKRWSRRRNALKKLDEVVAVTLPTWDIDFHQKDLSKEWLKDADPIVRDVPPLPASQTKKNKGTQQQQQQHKKKKPRPNTHGDNNYLISSEDGTKKLKLWIKEIDEMRIEVYRNTKSGEKVNVKLPSPWISKGWYLMRNTRGEKLYWWNKKTNKSVWREGQFEKKPPGV